MTVAELIIFMVFQGLLEVFQVLLLLLLMGQAN